MNTLPVGDQRFDVEQIIEALSPHVLAKRLDRLDTVLDARLGSIALGLEDLYQSHNAAACLRTVEGLGIQHVITAELRSPFPAGTGGQVNHRVTTSAHNWITVDRVKTTEELLGWARARDMKVFGAGPRAEHTLDSLPVDRPILLLFGNERDGLREQTLAACDGCFRIPMHGFTESYNVSVSVGMALSALTARRRALLAEQGQIGDLPDLEKRHLLARWLLRDVRAADKIVARKLAT